MTSAPDINTAMQVEYFVPVITAVNAVFETMLQCTPSRSEWAVKEGAPPAYELSAVIGVSGQLAGTIVLSMSRKTAFEVLNRTVAEDASETESALCDAVGELTNMIAGQTKSQLEPLELEISIPSIVIGKNLVTHYPSKVTPVAIHFESEIGPFTIEYGFADTK